MAARKQSPSMAKNRVAAKAGSANSHPLAVIGIGASAGGLEALDQFMSQVPGGCGVAFVVVQHLDPSHKGMLPELLQRVTPLPVLEVKDRTKVKAGHIYVIPPNKDLSLLHGTLHLLEPVTPHGLRLPIDFFFRSLADDQREFSVGVILSGMGSDGTLGLRAIKDKSGTVFVQDPASAKFNAMPRSAIDAGLADVIAPAGELPGKILSFLGLMTSPARGGTHLAAREESALEKVVILLRAQTGHDFSLYKKSTLYRRVERRMSLHMLAKITDYVKYLQENSQETELLFKELLIGVTGFFRDPAVWEQLKDEVIPALIAGYPHGGALRAWTAGCSTGEEAYSLAIAFKETIAKLAPSKPFSLQIFATDLDQDAIERARMGVFPPGISADVSEECLRRFFVQHEQGYQIIKEIREMVIFAPHNVAMDPPFTRLDFLTCRNLLIYLDASLQGKLLRMFHYCLKPGGVLILGSSETAGSATDLFASLPGKTRIYRRVESVVRADWAEFPSSFGQGKRGVARGAAHAPNLTPAPSNLQALADQLLLQRFAPAAVLVTAEGDILYISGKIGKYLEPAAGKANWNLFAMAREGLATALPNAFRQALRNQEPMTLRQVKITTSGGFQFVDILIQSLTEPAGLHGMVIVAFSEVEVPPACVESQAPRRKTADKSRLEALAAELRQSYVENQRLRDEMQTSQEELKSANEELQSTNEELQSTNEELTTSKEEMQSMNEELHTLNHELQAKVDELSLASNDIKNLLNSTGIATLFLDDALNIRRFTPQTTSIIKLIPGDAGRPLTDIVTQIDYPTFADDAHEVLRSLVFIEKQVTSRDGRWFTVRIMPYRTFDNRIDGLVVTFYDITSNKSLEAQLRQTQAALEARIKEPSAPLTHAGRTRAASTGKQPPAPGRSHHRKS